MILEIKRYMISIVPLNSIMHWGQSENTCGGGDGGKQLQPLTVWKCSVICQCSLFYTHFIKSSLKRVHITRCNQSSSCYKKNEHRPKDVSQVSSDPDPEFWSISQTSKSNKWIKLGNKTGQEWRVEEVKALFASQDYLCKGTGKKCLPLSSRRQSLHTAGPQLQASTSRKSYNNSRHVHFYFFYCLHRLGW